MYDEGVGDSAIRSQISIVDDTIQQAKTNRQSAGQHVRSRRELLLQLSASFAYSSETAVASDAGALKSLERELSRLEDKRRQRLAVPAASAPTWVSSLLRERTVAVILIQWSG